MALDSSVKLSEWLSQIGRIPTLSPRVDIVIIVER
jgi:hypothetical protein